MEGIATLADLKVEGIATLVGVKVEGIATLVAKGGRNCYFQTLKYKTLYSSIISMTYMECYQLYILKVEEIATLPEKPQKNTVLLFISGGDLSGIFPLRISLEKPASNPLVCTPEK